MNGNGTMSAGYFSLTSAKSGGGGGGGGGRPKSMPLSTNRAGVEGERAGETSAGRQSSGGLHRRTPSGRSMSLGGHPKKSRRQSVVALVRNF